MLEIIRAIRLVRRSSFKMRSGGAVLCAPRRSVIWRVLTGFWNYPRQHIPEKWGAGRLVLPPSGHPPPPPPKEKFSGISLRRELFPQRWDFFFFCCCSQCRLGVEALAPRLGVSVGRTGQYCTGNFIVGEITANRIHPGIMRMSGGWKKERIFPNIHKQIWKVWRRGQGDEAVRERAHLHPSMRCCLSTPKAGAYTGLCVAGTRELFARDTAGSWQASTIPWEQICERLHFRLAKVIIGDFA